MNKRNRINFNNPSLKGKTILITVGTGTFGENFAEKIFMTANYFASDRITKFNVVRYGNVLGSRGSVVPYFKRLKEQGLDIPITDKRMTRFWNLLNNKLAF